MRIVEVVFLLLFLFKSVFAQEKHNQDESKSEFCVASVSYENSFVGKQKEGQNSIGLFEGQLNYPVIFDSNNTILISGIEYTNFRLLSVQKTNFIENYQLLKPKIGLLKTLSSSFYYYTEISPYYGWKNGLRLDFKATKFQLLFLFGKSLVSNLNIALGGVFDNRYEQTFLSPVIMLDYRCGKSQIYIRYPDFASYIFNKNDNFRYGIEVAFPFKNFIQNNWSGSENTDYVRFQSYKFAVFSRYRMFKDLFCKINFGYAFWDIQSCNALHRPTLTFNFKSSIYFQLIFSFIK